MGFKELDRKSQKSFIQKLYKQKAFQKYNELNKIKNANKKSTEKLNSLIVHYLIL